jgi:thermitase
LLVGALMPLPTTAQDASEYLADEIVVKLITTSDLAAFRADYDLTLIDQFGLRPIYRFRIPAGSLVLDTLEQIENDIRVLYAEPNYLAETPEGRAGRGSWSIGSDSGEYAAQWGPEQVRLAEAHTISRGNAITIAILDTGIDDTHPAFAGRLVAGYDFVDDDALPREAGSTSNTGYGHGTHVAGIVALIAPDAQIMPIRVLDIEGRGNIWVLAEALQYAVDPDQNPATADGAAVINLSLGTLRRTSLLEELIDEITCANNADDDGNDGSDGSDNDNGDDGNDGSNCIGGGAVVVSAAGNSGDTTPHYPAAEVVAGTLAVAASQTNDQTASFSTYGNWVHLSAPGDQIISTVPGGEYATWSGTSMAAPYVAGVAALVRSANMNLTATEATTLIVTKSQSVCSVVPLRVDAAAAVGLNTRPPSPCYVALPIIYS